MDAGEKSALACALAHSSGSETLILCDEMQARQACRALSLPVIGSIELIVEAARAERATRLQAVASLEELPRRRRLHVKAELLAQTIAALSVE